MYGLEPEEGTCPGMSLEKKEEGRAELWWGTVAIFFLFCFCSRGSLKGDKVKPATPSPTAVSYIHTYSDSPAQTFVRLASWVKKEEQETRAELEVTRAFSGTCHKYHGKVKQDKTFVSNSCPVGSIAPTHSYRVRRESYKD